MIRIFRRRRGLNRIQKLADFKTAQLDIRNIVSNSIALKDFFRCFLTPSQLKLLAHQRTRVADPEFSDAGKQAEHDIDHDPIGEYDSKAFAEAMIDYEPENLPDYKLLQGVLFRYGDFDPKDSVADTSGASLNASGSLPSINKVPNSFGVTAGGR